MPEMECWSEDFLISPEGQKIFEEKFRFATSTKNYGFERWYPEKGIIVDRYENAEERWQKLLVLPAPKIFSSLASNRTT
jgi:hypothetical protein